MFKRNLISFVFELGSRNIAHMHRIMNSNLRKFSTPTTQAEHLGESVTSRPFLLQLELAQTEHWCRRTEVGHKNSFFHFLGDVYAVCTSRRRRERREGRGVDNPSNPPKKNLDLRHHGNM